MLFFLTTQPLWVSGTILVVLTTALATAGPAIVRRFVAIDKLADNNEVAGFKFATIGVLYAVLLAFAIILWERPGADDLPFFPDHLLRTVRHRDRPLSGVVKVDQDPLIQVLADLRASGATPAPAQERALMIRPRQRYLCGHRGARA